MGEVERAEHGQADGLGGLTVSILVQWPLP